MKGLQGETEETLEGIKLSISTIEKLFQSYSTYCSNLMPALPPVGAGDGADPPGPCPCQPRSPTAPLRFQEEPQLWEFPPSLVFGRMDSFLRRLKTIEVTAQRFGAQRQGTCEPPLPRGRGAGPLRVAPEQTPLQPRGGRGLRRRRGAEWGWEPSTLRCWERSGVVPTPSGPDGHPGASLGRMLLGSGELAPATPGHGEPGFGTKRSRARWWFVLARSCTRRLSSS